MSLSLKTISRFFGKTGNPEKDSVQTGPHYNPSELEVIRQYFEESFYRTQVSESVPGDILQHYLIQGAKRGINPAPWFDSSYYLSTNTDVADAGVNPFAHYLMYGQFEGRLPNDQQQEPGIGWTSRQRDRHEFIPDPTTQEDQVTETPSIPDTDKPASQILLLTITDVTASGIEVVSTGGAGRDYGITVRIDHQQALEINLPLPGQPFQSTITLPGEYYDGRVHLIEVSSPEATSPARAVAVLPFIGTPWEHLQASHFENVISGVNPLDAYRYASLKLQMAKNSGGLNPAVVVAHNCVCLGYHEKKNYSPLSLATCEEPVASIIIPVHNKFHLTHHCVASLILAYNQTSFEVIVADDASSNDTLAGYDTLKGVRLLCSEKNLGFGGICNKAAAEARGQYLIFLNNDTEVTSGWVDELVRGFEGHENISMTGSKLLNEDGSLQEAGGIVWDNGQPWNVGRGQNPQLPAYNYARDVDYLSGAALCVKHSVWDAVGAFSPEFQPAYYEDTDLAFKVRDAGYRTVYTPHSAVFHFEGLSNGRDVNTTTGFKRFQKEHEGIFKNKWAKAFKGHGKVGEDLNLHKDRNIVARALVVDHSTPNPNQDAGSYAALQEIKTLQRLGFKITFLPENMAHLGKANIDLQRMGIEVLHAPFVTSLQQALEQRPDEFDLIYITRYDVARRALPTIHKLAPHAKVLFNNADLHFLRELRSVHHGATDLDRALTVRTDELALMRDVDAILTYNESEEAVILSHNLRSDNIFRCPWVATCKPTPASYVKRSGLLFLGGFKHAPNQDAVQYFLDEIQDLLKLDAAQGLLHVVGSHPPEKLRNLDEAGNIHLYGFVDDLADAFNAARVFVAPLRFGAGIKGKIIEAMAYGLPVVTTSVGAEAIGLVNGINALIADDAEGFAHAIMRLSTDKDLWRSIRQNALATIAENYSPAKADSSFSLALNHLGLIHSKPYSQSAQSRG